MRQSPLSPVKRALLYDFPQAYELNQNIPHWDGFYDQIAPALQGKPFKINAPLFEKIKQGEVWRLFTPIFLHGDIFHILFNMAWAIIIGRQIESRIGVWKTILFIMITAAISNTAQYLMSGPNFIGYSGVLCGMFGFIWIRQRHCPWEEYDLERSTALFIFIFVMGVFSLQVLAFFLNFFANIHFNLPIANTAHLTGGLTGAFLALLPYFSRKESTYHLQ